MKKKIGTAALLLSVFLGGCGELWSEPVGTVAAVTAAENGGGAAEYEITELDFRTEDAEGFMLRLVKLPHVMNASLVDHDGEVTF